MKTNKAMEKELKEIIDRAMTSGSIIGVEHYKNHSLAWETEREIFSDNLLKLFTESLKGMLDDVEFRLIDNRISPYDEKFEIMKADMRIIREHAELERNTK